MKKLTKKGALLSAGTALVLMGSVVGIALAKDEAETAVGVPAATLVRAINAASQAKEGDITKVEVETEDGKTMIEVEVLSKDGKTYEVSIEAASGKVLSIEQDDEDDKNEMDEKGEADDKE